jgi:hypothetical protein
MRRPERAGLGTTNARGPKPPPPDVGPAESRHARGHPMHPGRRETALDPPERESPPGGSRGQSMPAFSRETSRNRTAKPSPRWGWAPASDERARREPAPIEGRALNAVSPGVYCPRLESGVRCPAGAFVVGHACTDGGKRGQRLEIGNEIECRITFGKRGSALVGYLVGFRRGVREEAASGSSSS